MLPSLEVRWFHRGTVPLGFLEWLGQGEQKPEEQPRRLDHYLRLGGTDSLGIKLREGRIEIKRRLRQDGVILFDERVQGVVEHWRKWGMELAGGDADLSAILVPPSAWVGVQKERHLLGLRFLATDERSVPPEGALPQTGCLVELSEIRAEGQAWWGLCFEAYGDESLLRETLMFTVGHMLTRGPTPLPLEAANSYGYPRWLALLEQGTGNVGR